MTKPEETPGQQLEQAILDEDVVYNALEVAVETGASLEQAQRLWRALGFPDRGSERAFTQSDADAVSTLLALVEQGAIDFDMAVDLTRAVGQTMAAPAEGGGGTPGPSARPWRASPSGRWRPSCTGSSISSQATTRPARARRPLSGCSTRSSG